MTASPHRHLCCIKFTNSQQQFVCFLELYLEELSDIIPTLDTDCQTDALLDKPATPLFIPAKTGKDVGTQIEEGEVGDPNMGSYESCFPGLIFMKIVFFFYSFDPFCKNKCNVRLLLRIQNSFSIYLFSTRSWNSAIF